MDTSTSSDDAPRKGSWFKRILFGLLLLLGLIALVPLLVSKFGKGAVENWFNDRHAGQLQLSEVNLSWFNRQSLKGLQISETPGQPILTGDLELPSLKELAEGRGVQLGSMKLSVTADLVRSADGSTNLERALSSLEEAPSQTEPKSGEGAGTGQSLGDMQLDLQLVDSQVTLRTEAEQGPRLSLSELELTARQTPGEPWTLSSSAKLQSERSAQLLSSPGPVNSGGDQGGQGQWSVQGQGEWLEGSPDNLNLKLQLAQLDALALMELFSAEALDASLIEVLAQPLNGQLELGTAEESSLQSLGQAPAKVWGVGSLETGNNSMPFELALRSAPFVDSPVDGAGDPMSDGAAWDLSFAMAGAQFDTVLIDRLAEQDGLLVETFGAALKTDLQLDFSGDEPAELSGPIRLHMHSNQSDMRFVGRYEGGHLLASSAAQESGLAVQLQLGPLFNERIVGRLVPLVVSPTRPTGSEPVALQVTDVDVDLNQSPPDLNALIQIGLGPAEFQVLPALAAQLGSGASGASGGLGGLPALPGLHVAKDQLLNLRIENGLVHYDKLKATVDGQEMPLLGTYNLLSGQLNVSGQLPAQLYKEKLERELGSAARYASDLVLGFQLTGTPSAPRLKVELPDLKQTLEKGIQGGLRDLLNRELSRDR